MPRQSKTTVKPPTIRERANEPPAPDDGLPTLTDEPTPTETTSTNGVSLMRLGKTSDGKELAVEMWPDKHKQRLAEMARDENRIHGEFSIDAPTPLVELHLRRVGPILTDTGETVRIPAPARLPDGARVRVSIYRED